MIVLMKGGHSYPFIALHLYASHYPRLEGYQNTDSAFEEISKSHVTSVIMYVYLRWHSYPQSREILVLTCQYHHFGTTASLGRSESDGLEGATR